MSVSPTDLKAPGDRGESLALPAVTPVPSTGHSPEEQPGTAEALDTGLSKERREVLSTVPMGANPAQRSRSMCSTSPVNYLANTTRRSCCPCFLCAKAGVAELQAAAGT